jgi:hypothetical protein
MTSRTLLAGVAVIALGLMPVAVAAHPHPGPHPGPHPAPSPSSSSPAPSPSSSPSSSPSPSSTPGHKGHGKPAPSMTGCDLSTATPDANGAVGCIG